MIDRFLKGFAGLHSNKNRSRWTAATKYRATPQAPAVAVIPYCFENSLIYRILKAEKGQPGGACGWIQNMVK